MKSMAPKPFYLVVSTLLATLVAASPARSAAVSGTVSFEGNVVFAAPIAGIALQDLTASSGPGIQATKGGETCTFDTPGAAAVSAGGAYPDGGSLAVGISIDRGGPNPPDGTCLVQIRATGSDGASVTAKGAVTVEITTADIAGNATIMVADDIVVRQSKPEAGLTKDCLKYVKKQMKMRAKCNSTLLLLGGTDGAPKCKTGGEEPVDCDPADYAEAVVALAFGDNDQQVDPMSAEEVDKSDLKDQLKCQKTIGKAAVNFTARRNQLVQKACVDAGGDSEACRAQAGKDSRKKLAVIDKCANAQLADMDTARLVPEVGDECGECISGGTLDRKCLKDCFELELATLSDGVMGDIAECGNGIVQGGEACDDGNVASGDCCSATCTIEAAGSQECGIGICQASAPQCDNGEPVVCTPGTPDVEAGNCEDGLDNDCDGAVDGDDPDCP